MNSDQINLVDAFDELRYKMAFLTEVAVTTEMHERMDDQNNDVAMGFFCLVRETNEEMSQFRNRLIKYYKKEEIAS